MKQIIKLVCIVVLAGLLVACEMAPAPRAAVTATSVSGFKPARSTPTILAAPLIPVPTIVTAVSPTASIVPTPTLMSTSTSTALPSSSTPSSTPTFPPVTLSAMPEGLRIVYLDEAGNLFVENAGEAPLQLTHSGDNDRFLFSEDGERLIFFHKHDPLYFDLFPAMDIYSIRIDGTQEKLLVSNNLLEALGFGYNEFTRITFLTYVPGSRQALFSTVQGNEQLATLWPYHDNSKRNLDLISVNIVTGELKILLPPGKGGNSVVSPDGRMAAVQASGHIDVIGIDGRMIRRNLVTYTPTTPHELIPDMFWTEDSSELLVTLPIDPEYQYTRAQCTQDVAARSVWRYAIDGGEGVQTLLNPPPIGESNRDRRYFIDFDVSPDGNWILYEYDHNFGCDVEDETVIPGRYLGNLREGTAWLYAPPSSPLWSSDSKHFVYEVWKQGSQGLFLGSVDEPPVFLDVSKDYLLGWADRTHYMAYYLVDGSIVGMLGEIGGEITYFPVSAPAFSFEDFNRYHKFDFIYLDH